MRGRVPLMHQGMPFPHRTYEGMDSPNALGDSPHSFSRHPLIMRALAGYIFAPALHEGKLPSS